MLTFLAEGWFESVRALLSTAGATVVSPGLTVEHVVDDVPERGRVHHWQRFAGCRLVAWQSGRPPRRDLTIRRTYQVDRDDLLSRGTASAAWIGTELSSSTVTGDVLGSSREAFTANVLPDGLVLTFAVEVPDTPFGPLRADYSVTADGVEASDPTEADVVVRAPYPIILRWLHDEDTLLGHLISCADYGAVVEGDLFKASALEAVVSTPRSTSVDGHASVLRRYAACRHAESFAAVIDAIDAFTE